MQTSRQADKQLFHKYSIIAKLKIAFTLAEVLITLAVIGVVASLSIPNLIAHIDDVKFTSARERAVYNIREAAMSIRSDNGSIGGLGTSIQFRDALATRLATSKLCDTITGCFHTANIKNVAGNAVGPINGLGTTWGAGNPVADPGAAAGMILNNGTTTSVLYNTNCKDTPLIHDVNNAYGQNNVCANIIFDTNGFAPPNQVGKDIGFATVINPVNTVVVGISPDTADLADADWSTAQANCMTKGDTWHLPTKDELNSLVFNFNLTGLRIAGGYNYWSSTLGIAPQHPWSQYPVTGIYSYHTMATALGVRCVRR